MKTTGNESLGISHYTIDEISNAEMDKMIEAREMLRANLINHATESKKEYLNDDQLKGIFSILVVLTRGCEHRPKTSFDEVNFNVELAHHDADKYAKEMEEVGLTPLPYGEYK